MNSLIQSAQLAAWVLVAAYFLILVNEKTQVKNVKNDIVAQLEMQVNYSPTGG